MQLIYGTDIPDFGQPTVVTVGSFDGVHRGHQALLEAAREEAARIGGKVVVVSFEPHPRIALGKAEGLLLLTELEEKIELLAGYGVDCLVILPFDLDFAKQSGIDFVNSILIDRIGAKSLIAGYNHRFGHDHVMASELTIEGLKVVRVERCEVEGEQVSSSAIRRLIADKNYTVAERLLGHPLKCMKS